MNLTVDANLLQRARAANINLSQTLEQALSERMRRIEAEAWLRENREALDAYNEHVDRDGVFSESTRLF